MPRDCERPAGKLMILFLVKFLNKEAHVRDLLDGKIYVNRLSWFKRMEAAGVSGRLDRHEGAVAWHQPDRVNLVINDWNLTPDLAGACRDAWGLVKLSQHLLHLCRTNCR